MICFNDLAVLACPIFVAHGEPYRIIIAAGKLTDEIIHLIHRNALRFAKLCGISLQKRSNQTLIPGTRRVRFLGTSTRGLVRWASGDLVSKIQYGGLGMDDCFMRAAYNEEFAMCGANGVPAALNGRMISIEPIQRLANADIRSRTLPNIVSGRKGSSLELPSPAGAPMSPV